MFRSKLRATGLVVPLLAFVLASFVFPILALMWQGIHNDTFERLMPNLTEELRVVATGEAEAKESRPNDDTMCRMSMCSALERVDGIFE